MIEGVDRFCCIPVTLSLKPSSLLDATYATRDTLLTKDSAEFADPNALLAIVLTLSIRVYKPCVALLTLSICDCASELKLEM